MTQPMMKCGHAANGVCSRKGGVDYDPPVPSCVICSCMEIDPFPPPLEGRMARCDYYGLKPRHNECDDCSGKEVCSCERPSSTELAFFEHRPDKPFDRFYCGCHSWD